jgi:hypothetical protein
VYCPNLPPEIWALIDEFRKHEYLEAWKEKIAPVNRVILQLTFAISRDLDQRAAGRWSWPQRLGYPLFSRYPGTVSHELGQVKVRATGWYLHTYTVTPVGEAERTTIWADWTTRRVEWKTRSYPCGTRNLLRMAKLSRKRKRGAESRGFKVVIRYQGTNTPHTL